MKKSQWIEKENGPDINSTWHLFDGIDQEIAQIIPDILGNKDIIYECKITLPEKIYLSASVLKTTKQECAQFQHKSLTVIKEQVSQWLYDRYILLDLNYTVQDEYHELRSKLTDEEADKVIIQKLRMVADQIESGKYPKVFGCKLPSDNLCQGESFIEEITVVMSNPWPG